MPLAFGEIPAQILARFLCRRLYCQLHGSRLSASPPAVSSFSPREEASESSETQARDAALHEALRRLCREGDWRGAVRLLDERGEECGGDGAAGLRFLLDADACLLKECIRAKSLIGARHVHDHHVRRNGFAPPQHHHHHHHHHHHQHHHHRHRRAVNHLLLDAYLKCGSFEDADHVFHSMPHKDEDTWTYMMGLCVRSDRPQHAFDLFSAAVQQGLKINGVACVNALKACTTSSRLMHLHAYIIGHGLGYNLYVRNTLLDMYCKRGSIDDALHLFMELQVFSVVSWNTIIAGLIQHDLPKKALELFDDMKNKGFRPDGVTFLCVIKACTDEMQGVLHRIHAEVISNALESDSFIASALIDMYATLGDLKYASTILRRAGSQDAPLWNSIILGHAEHGDAAEAMALFGEMEEETRMAPDKVTYLSLLKACARLQDVASGGSVHGRITECGMEDRSFVESAIIDMYAKCGAIGEARHVFDRTIEPDLVSWNAIIAAYCVSGSPLEALGLFREMVAEKDVAPDKVTYLTALKACASLGAFQHGKHIHACIYEDGFDLDAFTGSMLIDMYGKCGMAWHARDVFDTMLARDAVSWSAMIAGYGQLGRVNEAVELLLEMDRECIPIDDVTFVGILSACTHSGLVEEGCACFDAMKKRHGIAPTSEICACMVDLLGRAGQMMEALAFIKVVDVEPTASVWMALLNACKLSADLGLARYASQRVRDLDPRCTSAFVLLSNICVTA